MQIKARQYGAKCQLFTVEVPHRTNFEKPYLVTCKTSTGRWAIEEIKVPRASEHRQRYGTRLYEHGARHACAASGRGLVSDYRRSDAAEGFWRKQVEKGRARCMMKQRPGFRYDPKTHEMKPHWPCFMYELLCPVPASLDGRRAVW